MNPEHPHDATLTQLGAEARLGRYVIEALLGAGGMGEVYRARDVRLDRTVAIKVVRTQWAGRADFRQRLEREARAISVLNHPHICTLYDIGEQDGTTYLVMEYLEGQTLAAHLRDGPLPLQLLLRYGVQAAAALAAAHARGIIHRDLKTSNLMVTPWGLKILDFGLAKSITQSVDTIADLDASVPGVMAGTPAYMSPEQTRGEALDGRSDIFSLGSVLYEAATGRAPFRGPSLIAILHEIATAVPPAASSIRPDLPAELDLILKRMLAKEKAERYSSAEEVEETLARLQDGPRSAIAVVPEREPDTLVGREAELGKLEELLEKAREGSGKIVLITGEPGIGKTALVARFVRSLRRGHPETLIGRGACVEQYGTSEAYLPFLEALAGLLQGPSRDRVTTVLRRYAPTWCLQFPAFASTSGIEYLQREAIGATKERMLRELGDALSALAANWPVVLLLEDLHWADPFSVDLLRHLGQRASGQRFLLIGTARAEDMERSQHPLLNCQRELAAHNTCVEIALGELDQNHIGRYLDVRFAPNSFSPEFAELIYRKTEGHPLFTAGALQFLSEKGDIAQRNGTWSLTRPLIEMDLEVPASVRSMIRKRLEAVNEQDRQALQYASVEGIEFTSGVLASLLGVDELDLEERLNRLDRVHRLILTGGEEELPDGSLATKYRFAHALYQNIFYEDLLTKRRVLLHRQAGETLARCYHGQTARIAAALTAHFERGRDFSLAIEYLIEAADVAMGRYANAAADEHYSHALRLTGKLPDVQQAHRRAQLYKKRGAVRVLLARYPEGVRDFTEVLGLARGLENPALECTALIGIADAQFWTHRLEDMGAAAEDAMRIADRIRDPALQSESRANLGRKHQGTGNLDAAAALYDESLAIARDAGQLQALPIGLTYRGLIHFFRTEYQSAETLFVEARKLSAELRIVSHLHQTLLFLGLTQANLGHVSEALATLNEGAEMARRNGNLPSLARTPNSIAWIYRELQDLEHAVALDLACVEASRACGSTEAEANSLINLVHDYVQMDKADKAWEAFRGVEAIRDRDQWHRWRFFGLRFQDAASQYWLWQNNLDGAEEHALALLKNATAHGVPKYMAVAHSTLARIAMARGDSRTAETELAAALQALHDHPAPLVEWRIHAILGRLRSQSKNPQGAREVYGCAAAIVENIAASITEKALRSTFLESPAVREVLEGSHGR
jgi:tetratricopeptide (TPR) repeat protein